MPTLRAAERPHIASYGQSENKSQTAVFYEADPVVKHFRIEDLTILARQEIGATGEQDDLSAELFYITPPEPISEWLSRGLGHLEPGQAEAVEPIFEEVIQIADEVRALKQSAEPDEAQIEVLQQVLEDLAYDLLQQLGVEADGTKAAQFIKLITDPEFTTRLPQKLSIEELNQLGTHEYKTGGLLKIFNDLLQDIEQKLRSLGGYSIKLHGMELTV